MTAVRLARATVIVCLFAAAVEVALGCASTAGLAPGDAIVALFVVGPYLLLASLAWRLRARATASRALLAVAVGLSAWGLATFGWHGYRYHAEPQYRALQNMALFSVPLLQWVAVLLVGLASLLVRPGSRGERPTGDA